MQLSQEDNLRLNVLLNQPLHAIRIDEGKMIVYGLTEKGEAKIQLNPNCKDELYVRRVKELISSHFHTHVADKHSYARSVFICDTKCRADTDGTFDE